MRAIAVRASNQFADGGSNDIWNRRVLPLAYIASHEIGQKDDKIGSLWKEVWDEGGQVTNSSTKTEHAFGVNLQEKLLPYIINSLIDALNDVSWHRRVMACTTLSELADMNILSPPPLSLGKKEVVTNETMLRAKRRAQASNKILATCTSLLVKSRVWDGKAALVTMMAKIASKWIGFQIHDKQSTSNILGIEFEQSRICPWIPIVRQSDSWNDLFLHDRWFDIKSKEIVTEDETEVDQTIIDGSTNKGLKKVDTERLDFAEEKKLFEDESKNDSSHNTSKDEIDEKNESQSLTFSGLCRALLEQGISLSKKTNSTFYSSESLVFRAAALKSLSQLLESFQEENSGNPECKKEFLYQKMSPILLSIIEGNEKFMKQDRNIEISKKKPIPPLIIARSIECLSSSMWQGMQETSDNKNIFANTSNLVKLFLHNCGPSQSAWTVRAASGLAAANLSLNAHSSSLRKIETIENLLTCTSLCQKDRRFWKVRYAGLKILLCLCQRLGVAPSHTGKIGEINDGGHERQLLLEALLPCKERIQEIAKISLSDNESKVTSIASDICNAISWWP